VGVAGERAREREKIKTLAKRLDLPGRNLVFGRVEQIIDERNKSRLAAEQAAAGAPAIPRDGIYNRADRIATGSEVVSQPLDIVFLAQQVKLELGPHFRYREQAADHEIRVDLEIISLVDLADELGQGFRRFAPIELEHAENQIRAA